MKLLGYEVEVLRTTYRNNGSLAVLIETTEGEPFATLTVNLASGIAEGDYAYVDTNNCEWAEKFIKENELGTPTGIMGYSGFCEYPLYLFDTSKIREAK
ncbi:MAG: DUF4313 domain-containing protein [Bacilli bacterium]|nr:DUF4313 domain-containing protein [Bacilli bacterium]